MRKLINMLFQNWEKWYKEEQQIAGIEHKVYRPKWGQQE